jgi:hypothetical protein
MRLLYSIILILLITVDRLWKQFSVSDSIASQFISHDLPRLASMVPQQAPEETLSSRPIPLGLEIHINHFSILVYCSPKVMLLAIDLHEHLVDEEGIAIPSVLPLQSSSVWSSEFSAPHLYGFVADHDLKSTYQYRHKFREKH